MIKLNEILRNIPISEYKGNLDIEVLDICFDSRKVQKGSIYVAQKGVQVDGHRFIETSIMNGAKTIVCEKYPDTIHEDITYVKVKHSNISLALLSKNFYNNPSKEIKLVGITGTNGKTSIATLLYKLFGELGYKVGLLSTIENYIGTQKYVATHTTPDIVTLNRLLREMVDTGCEYCFMEVSSHALVQQRTYGLHFTGGVFTNITHDHLDYHKTFPDYIKAKKSFFDQLGKDSFALINTDDKNGAIMTQNTEAKVYSYAIKSKADYHGKIVERHFDTTLIEINKTELWTNFIGDFNVYNLLAVYGVAHLLRIDDEALVALSSLKPVSGRLDTFVSSQGIIAVIDYAHTPDALKNVLRTLRPLAADKNLIVIVGAGGDRDKSKRPEMGRIATQWADKIIITSDNPRNESPENIIEDIYKGIMPEKEQETLCIVNRKEAIKTATMIAQQGDIIVIAGKGHENYQEIAGERYHFDDKEEIKKILS